MAEFSVWESLVLVSVVLGAFTAAMVYAWILIRKRRGAMDVFWGETGKDEYRWDWKKEKKRNQMKKKSKFVVREETRRRRIVKHDLKRCTHEDFVYKLRRDKTRMAGRWSFTAAAVAPDAALLQLATDFDAQGLAAKETALTKLALHIDLHVHKDPSKPGVASISAQRNIPTEPTKTTPRN